MRKLPMLRPREMTFYRLAASLFFPCAAFGQSIAIPWSGHGHDPQHTGISRVTSQPLQQIKWQMPVDLNPQYTATGALLIHYGVPLITRQNTVVVPVKTGAVDGFRVEARNAVDGALKWMQTSDYTQPPRGWHLPFGAALTPKNRVYFPGAGGTVYFRDAPDDPNGTGGQLAFYGLATYQANPTHFNERVKINTPITSDRYGNIYFGFVVLTSTTPSLTSGVARIAEDGTGTWVAAKSVVNDSAIDKLVHSCAPALSNDQKTLYFAVQDAATLGGYLVALDSRTLVPIASVRLKDVGYPTNDAILHDSGSSSPTIGPDGDVYFGVLSNPFGYNNARGWLLHFDASLAQSKMPGAFGWDITPSIVPASMVPAYQGTSPYLLFIKYNNYAGYGTGTGYNEMAVLDPQVGALDAISGQTTMQEVLKVASPTPDDQPGSPDARREWCVNTAAIDPSRKSIFASCEDGKTYRWDLATNTLAESVTLTIGIGQAYTPTAIGIDGTVYAIQNGTLFAVGATAP